MRLTDEQKEIIDSYYRENRKHLVHCVHAVYKRWLTPEQFEDCMGVVYEALCEAVSTFNPNKGNKLSTHVERVARARLATNLRNSKRTKRKLNECKDSLDQPATYSDSDNRFLTLGEVTADTTKNEDFSGANRYLNSLTKLQLKLIIMTLVGVNIKEICDILNISRGTYNLLLQRMGEENKMKLFRRG